MLEVKNVCVKYGSFTALDNISFTLSEGQWLMVSGPNGAGKSTLLETFVNGVPYHGDIILDGCNIKRLPPPILAHSIGVLSQHNSVGWPFTVKELVSLGRYSYRSGIFSGSDKKDDEAVQKALQLTGVASFENANVQTLSGGELQRVFLAQVLAQDPKILVLDEPSNHLDISYQKNIFHLINQWLKQPGKAVISTVHDLCLARRFATDVILISNGKTVAFGSPETVFSSTNLNPVYQTDVQAWINELYAPWLIDKDDNLSGNT